MAKQNSTATPKATKPKEKPLTRTQAEKALKDNLDAYKKYQVDRGKGVERSKNKHRVGYQAYKNAYRQLLEIKRAAGEIKPRNAAPAAAPAPAVEETQEPAAS